MLHTIEFGKLSAMLLDLVDSSDGFLYLRMAGTEPTVNAIWSKLSGKEGRGKKWSSEVKVPQPGQSYNQGVAAYNKVVYRTLRTRLPSELVDLAMIHPMLTVAEDGPRGFHLLTYEDGVPSGFYDRLNNTLSIPLKPEWAGWLWEQGQKPQTFFTLSSQWVYENGQRVEQEQVTETTKIPITRLDDTWGSVSCYQIRCDGLYKEAWTQIIREQLGLGINLDTEPLANERQRYTNGFWTIQPGGTGWLLYQAEERLVEAPTLNHLLTEAREQHGLALVIKAANHADA
jgi:hypothetical protein